MYPIRQTVALSPAADNDGITSAQSRSTAGNFTFDGVLVSGGVATLDSNANARQVVFDSTGNENTKTYRITGTVIYGSPTTVTEVLVGALSSGSTTNFFFTVTQIASDGGTVGAVKWGTSSIGSGQIIPVNMYGSPFELGIGLALTGTANFTLQETYDSVFDLAGTPVWFDDATIASKSANFAGKVSQPCRAVRLKINSGTGSVALSLVQSNTISG